MPSTYQVVDLFAGPGGLAEGFSAFSDPAGHHPFEVTLSVEKEASAHKTLQLRAFLRQFKELPVEYYTALNSGQSLPDWAKTHEREWRAALDEALQLELGTEKAAEVLDRRIASLVREGSPTVVIGGPPCQAYSLVGRSRNQGIHGYVPEQDSRHFLYREYIRILRGLRPAAFVMENVKGILSSSIDGRRIFDRVLDDLRAADGSEDSYQLFAIGRDCEGRIVLNPSARPSDFVVRSEEFGVPQARHRVIVVGLRRDIAVQMRSLVGRHGSPAGEPASVRSAITGLPALRSGLSKIDDGEATWRNVIIHQMNGAISALAEMPQMHDVASAALKAQAHFTALNSVPPRSSTAPAPVFAECPKPLLDWLSDGRLEVTLNHSTRGHMIEDLGRYFFSAVFTSVRGRAPKAEDFPSALAPAHANWASGKFADRFRTQRWDQPSTTVTSHISKDGHYFIHPDPRQCRSLTVREAARLQTFPDNYLFLGNRTEQYVQVGNAVPPFLAKQIAEVLWMSLPGSA
jgi:DNA (cytosine-5)-methyltransferase 1